MLRTPKGWTGPEVVDGIQVEGTFRAHQVPLAGVQDNPEHLAMLEAWMRSYRPEELFDEHGALVPELAALAPERATAGWAPTRTPTAAASCEPLELPDFGRTRSPVAAPGARAERVDPRSSARCCATSTARNRRANFRLFCPDETNSNRLGAVFEVDDRVPGRAAPTERRPRVADGRVMEVLSEHNCAGLARGLRC